LASIRYCWPLRAPRRNSVRGDNGTPIESEIHVITNVNNDTASVLRVIDGAFLCLDVAPPHSIAWRSRAHRPRRDRVLCGGHPLQLNRTCPVWCFTTRPFRTRWSSGRIPARRVAYTVSTHGTVSFVRRPLSYRTQDWSGLSVRVVSLLQAFFLTSSRSSADKPRATDVVCPFWVIRRRRRRRRHVLDVSNDVGHRNGYHGVHKYAQRQVSVHEFINRFPWVDEHAF